MVQNFITEEQNAIRAIPLYACGPTRAHNQSVTSCFLMRRLN